MEPFFSIIIPVYNGLSCDLPVCLKSIWEQPLDPAYYEVICVDDCSTDDTRKYLAEEQEKHNNLKVILNTQNIRQGGAKNAGIHAAQGQYVMFIDQDDYYHPDTINRCRESLVENPVEILVCDSAWQQKGRESNILQLNYPFTDTMDGQTFVQKNGFVLAPWRMICSKAFLLTNRLFFQEKVRIEDIDWGCRVVMAAQSMRYIRLLLVHYNRYDAQTTGLMKSNFAILKDQMFAAFRIFQLAELHKHRFLPLENMWKHHYKVALRMMLGCYAPIKEKKACIQQYCQGACDSEPFINMTMRFPLLYSFFSNLMIPFYRLAMKIFTVIRWYRRKHK